MKVESENDEVLRKEAIEIAKKNENSSDICRVNRKL